MDNNNAPKNDLTELRGHLFDTIRQLKAKDEPMDLDRAKTVAGVAKEIIASAKVEVDYIKATGQSRGSSFLEADDTPALPSPAAASGAGEQKGGILGRTVHRLK